ncbi:hypothetical protein CXG81DRAFT_26622 [Caulochytrium protostelioides]|uniref:Uncharacterized protein n=1 Tax=Caulochytrium protostelioides TaxID=1555241 RepID=A0A4P9X671_9FUNG|nr:hypothetical protein CXG81DRAFT_26622 [Caulochytrium protostelioides]|eukprot:RKP00676.1 hypothetical protein CXG81DRAFT_26622 [Caulochytrium protostelioides]
MRALLRPSPRPLRGAWPVQRLGALALLLVLLSIVRGPALVAATAAAADTPGATDAADAADAAPDSHATRLPLVRGRRDTNGLAPFLTPIDVRTASLPAAAAAVRAAPWLSLNTTHPAFNRPSSGVGAIHRIWQHTPAAPLAADEPAIAVALVTPAVDTNPLTVLVNATAPASAAAGASWSAELTVPWEAQLPFSLAAAYHQGSLYVLVPHLAAVSMPHAAADTVARLASCHSPDDRAAGAGAGAELLLVFDATGRLRACEDYASPDLLTDPTTGVLATFAQSDRTSPTVVQTVPLSLAIVSTDAAADAAADTAADAAAAPSTSGPHDAVLTDVVVSRVGYMRHVSSRPAVNATAEAVPVPARQNVTSVYMGSLATLRVNATELLSARLTADAGTASTRYTWNLTHTMGQSPDVVAAYRPAAAWTLLDPRMLMATTLRRASNGRPVVMTVVTGRSAAEALPQLGVHPADVPNQAPAPADAVAAANPTTAATDASRAPVERPYPGVTPDEKQPFYDFLALLVSGRPVWSTTHAAAADADAADADAPWSFNAVPYAPATPLATPFTLGWVLGAQPEPFVGRLVLHELDTRLQPTLVPSRLQFPDPVLPSQLSQLTIEPPATWLPSNSAVLTAEAAAAVDAAPSTMATAFRLTGRLAGTSPETLWAGTFVWPDGVFVALDVPGAGGHGAPLAAAAAAAVAPVRKDDLPQAASIDETAPTAPETPREPPDSPKTPPEQPDAPEKPPSEPSKPAEPPKPTEPSPADPSPTAQPEPEPAPTDGAGPPAPSEPSPTPPPPWNEGDGESDSSLSGSFILTAGLLGLLYGLYRRSQHVLGKRGGNGSDGLEIPLHHVASRSGGSGGRGGGSDPGDDRDRLLGPDVDVFYDDPEPSPSRHPRDLEAGSGSPGGSVSTSRPPAASAASTAAVAVVASAPAAALPLPPPPTDVPADAFQGWGSAEDLEFNLDEQLSSQARVEDEWGWS